MEQRKIGGFLKELRKDKGITQEQLAEILNVSNRTVSRWETGSSMPDLSVLIELADYYDVEIREILDGERKSEKMADETRDDVQKIVEYSNAEKELLLKRVKIISIVGLISFVVGLIMLLTEPALTLPVYDFVKGFCLGISLGTMITMVLYTTGMLAKIKNKKSKNMKMIAVVCIIVIFFSFVASVIASIL